MASEHALRREMVRIGRLMYERGLLVALDGNLSALLPSGDVLCTRSGVHKGLMTEDDLVVVDRRGEVLRGSGRPTSEIRMHLACYDARPDVRAVVHAHPPVSVAFTVAGESLARCVLPEVVLTLGTVPTSEYATTGTPKLAEIVRRHVEEHDAILLDRHGAVCVGRDLVEAFCRLETMEHAAIITKHARDLGRVRELPPEEAERLRAMGRERFGGGPLPEACRACTGCGGGGRPPEGPALELRMARLTSRPLRAAGAAEAGALEAVVVDEVLRALRRGG